MPPRIDQKILGEYPYPIARCYYRAYKQVREDSRIHENLRFLYEVIVRYPASILISQYLSEGGGDAAINNSLKDLDRPSLGHWMGWLRDIINYYNKQKKTLVVSELSTFLNEKFRDNSAVLKAYNEIKTIVFEQMNKGDNKQAQVVTVREFLELLVQYRNGIAHGGLSNYHRDKVVAVLGPGLEELLDKMSFITRYRLVWIASVQRASGRTRQYEHFITDLTSNNTASVREPYIMNSDDAIPEQLYINAADQEYSPALNLHPLLIFNPCLQCSTEQVFMLNEGNESKLSYYSYQCEHNFSPTDYIEDLRALRESVGSGAAVGLPRPATPIQERVPTREEPPVVKDTPATQPEQSVAEVETPKQEQPLPVVVAEAPKVAPATTATPTATPATLPTSTPLNQPVPPAVGSSNNPNSQPLTPPIQPVQQQPMPVQQVAPSQISCWNCGRLNGVDRQNCFNCGANLRQPLPPQPYPQANRPGYGPPPAGYQQPVVPTAPSQQVCPRCGTINRMERKFCTNCGLQLAGVAPQPRQPQQPQQPRPQPTPNAAANPQIRCPRCGTINRADRKFCTNCGLRLA